MRVHRRSNEAGVSKASSDPGPSRYPLLYAILVCTAMVCCRTMCLFAQQDPSAAHTQGTSTPSARAIHTITGKPETARVPMVSEAWSATIGRVTENEHRELPEIGKFPGAREWKRQANARRKALERSGSRVPNGTLTPPVLQSGELQTYDRQSATTPTAQGVVFRGPSESDTHLIPPDSQLAAGPDYVVVAVNSLLAIYDKSGNLQGSFQNFSSFFSSLAITGQIFDPRIIYDQTDQRFIFSAAEIDFTNLTNGHVFLAVSATSDPTGVWHKWALDSEGFNAAGDQRTFPDFPGLGLSQSAVYITTNQFELSRACLSTDTTDCCFSDAWVKVIGLPELLLGGASLNVTSFTSVQTPDGLPAFAIQPALTYGSSSSEFLVAARFDAYQGTALNLFAIPTAGTPSLSTVDITVPAYTFPPDAIQPGTNNGIDTDDFSSLNAVWAKGSLWLGQNTAASSGGSVGAQWYQIQITDLDSASLAQSGMVTGSGDAYYPALTVKADGATGMAFTTSSSYQPPSAAFTVREVRDPAGTMRTYSIYQAGTSSYDEPNGENRWSDYSAMSEDPDGNSFWAFAEYAGTPDPNFVTAGVQVIAPPALSLSPALLDLQDVPAGIAGSPIAVTVTNISQDNIALGAAGVTGEDAADFTVSNDTCSGMSLGANQTCTLSVTLKPSVNTWESGLLSIPYGTGNLVTAGMRGFGAIEAILSFKPSPAAFPPTVLQSASVPQVVTLTNTGNASAQFLGNPTISGDFAQTNNCGSSLAAGASCDFTVTFHPTTAGTEQGSISVLLSTSGQTPFVNLSGVGITAPAVLFCPASLTFPSQAVNTASAARPIIVTNNGSDSLTVTGITAKGDFSETDDCVGSFPARSSCIIQVTFTPKAAGSRSGTITMTDDAQGSPQMVTLVGTGSASSGDLFLIPPGLVSGIKPGGAPPLTSATSPAAQARLRAKRINTEASLYFEPNVGQFTSGVEFVARTERNTIALRRTGLTLRVEASRGNNPRELTRGRQNSCAKTAQPLPLALQLPESSVAVNMSMVGARPGARLGGMGELAGRADYFIGNDPGRWRTNVGTYRKVRLQGIYPGIDLVYCGNQRHLEYDFLVAPSADPAAIRLRFNGESRMRVNDQSGELVLETSSGDVRFQKPLLYQTGSGDKHSLLKIARRGAAASGRQSVEGHFALLGSNEVGFEVGAYDRTKPLVIDPIMSFSTYLAGSNEDSANGIVLDSAGNAYITGTTYSPDFPIASGAYKTTCGSSDYPCVTFQGQPDAFVSKLGPDGSLIYPTYLGGESEDHGMAIAVDSSGNAYVTGYTLSPDFPVTPGAFQATGPNGGNSDSCSGAFITKLNPAGSHLIYSTYLGGGPGD